MSIKVKVPATSANLGSGFDCIGVALNLYNYVEVEQVQKGLKIILPKDDIYSIPTDERNLVYRAITKIFELAEMPVPGLIITLTNNIPVTRGLGSSSASIIGGLYAANIMCGSKFSTEELMKISADIEGHPDNVIPAITGGIAVAAIEHDKVYYVNHHIEQDLTFATVVPDFHVATKASRGRLPKVATYPDAIFNMGRASLLMASFITGKYENLNCATADRMHQRHRMSAIKGAYQIFEEFDKIGVLGKYMSGSGPALIAIIRGDEDVFYSKMSCFLEKNFPSWRIHMLKVDNEGVQIE